ncbi:MAG: hypothetical protein E6J72_19770 [Deltaproteobacteria bacterium]|nr:MAG: hypothetical protein E6J72_19770 [Deltaproteobacteria bacterium]
MRLPMSFKLERSKASYFADFVVYPAAVFASGFLLCVAPRGERPHVAVAVLSGLIGWSLLEYALHRFILHGLEPFRSWHAEHHNRPHALIGTPTAVSATAIIVLIFVPALLISGLWLGTGLTLGVTAGYLGYACTHHAIHHWHTESAWLKHRQRLHALHHHSRAACQFGVITSVWDYVFGSRYRLYVDLARPTVRPG